MFNKYSLIITINLSFMLFWPSATNIILVAMSFLYVELNQRSLNTVKIRTVVLTIIGLLVSVVAVANNKLDLYLITYCSLTFITLFYARKIHKTNINIIFKAILFSYCCYGFTITVGSIRHLGFNFYPLTYNIIYGGLGSVTYLSNSMAVAFLIYVYLLLNGTYRTSYIINLLGCGVLIMGWLSGGRLFVVAALLSILPIYFKLLNWRPVKTILLKKSIIISLPPVIVVMLLPPLVAQSRFGSEGLFSQRFSVWLSILEKNGLANLSDVDLEGEYYISAYHNFFLDSLAIYGKLAIFPIILVSLLILYFAIYIYKMNSPLYLRVHAGIILLISCVFLMITVIPRADVLPIFILFSSLYFITKSHR
jgi:hypothetical protein